MLHPDRMALLRVCREFGCLPNVLEERTSMEFTELIVYVKICDDAEREAHEKARRESEAKRPRRR